MKLELSQKLQQQQILAPQMILSMDILLLPALDLEQRIQQEFAENPALEIVDEPAGGDSATEPPPAPASAPAAGSESFSRLWDFENEPRLLYEGPRRRYDQEQANAKHEALLNTAGKGPGLKESLIQQLHLEPLAAEVLEAAEAIVNNLDHRGYLLHPPEEIRCAMEPPPSEETFAQALAAVRSLDPPGVGAESLVDCLLLQLQRDRQEYPLETEIIRSHLRDLGENKIPKIARELGRTIDEIKEAVEIIKMLDPLPGSRLEDEVTIYVRPDVIVEVLDGEIEVRVEGQSLPHLQVNPSCRELLKKFRGDRTVTDFVRRKVESAQWLIDAIEQRQRTLQDMARALVEHQRDFMLKGPEHLKALKMQTLADRVGVHISTVSRAVKGKYVQTPWGLYEMKYFFTGGVDNAAGEVESRRNVYRRIAEIIEHEDKRHPLSDTAIAEVLKSQGLKIARRTVTKYREQEGIPPSRLRREY